MVLNRIVLPVPTLNITKVFKSLPVNVTSPFVQTPAPDPAGVAAPDMVIPAVPPSTIELPKVPAFTPPESVIMAPEVELVFAIVAPAAVKLNPLLNDVAALRLKFSVLLVAIVTAPLPNLPVAPPFPICNTPTLIAVVPV